MSPLTTEGMLMYRKMNFKGRSALLAVVSLAAISLAVPAGASSYSNIGGTAYSSGATYTSSIVRTKQGTSKITAQFSSLPKNGLTLGTRANTGQGFGSNSWSKTETNIVRDVSTFNVSDGQRFVTYFSLNGSCDDWFGCSPYNFDGALYH